MCVSVCAWYICVLGIYVCACMYVHARKRVSVGGHGWLIAVVDGVFITFVGIGLCNLQAYVGGLIIVVCGQWY